MSCLECGRSCNPCENCGKCSDCCECDDLAAARRLLRGMVCGALLSLPIWAAILVFAANLVRAAEHVSRWAWMVR